MDQMLLAFWRQRDLESPWGRRLLIGLAVAGVCISLYFSPQWWQPVLGVSAPQDAQAVNLEDLFAELT
ncbi:MAG TPA: hypothetical protein VIN03_14370, partial [Roseateles sp.]